jgi:antitoxin component of MazEF toxin-antitoxin module
MTTIDTSLTTSGNSPAVRLPRDLMRISGIAEKSRVRLEAKKGKIIISKSANPRQSWEVQIKTLMKTNKDPVQEFADMNTASNDGLDNLPCGQPLLLAF